MERFKNISSAPLKVSAGGITEVILPSQVVEGEWYSQFCRDQADPKYPRLHLLKRLRSAPVVDKTAPVTIGSKLKNCSGTVQGVPMPWRISKFSAIERTVKLIPNEVLLIESEQQAKRLLPFVRAGILSVV